MLVHITQIKKRVAAALGYSLLAKAVLCAVSVVKGGLCSRPSRYKPCTKSNKCFCGYSCGYKWPFLADLLPFHIWKNDTATSILAGFCKLNHH